jgi:hypothetical protein
LPGQTENTIGSEIAEQGDAADCLERPLLRRSRFRQRLSASDICLYEDMVL